MVIEKKHKFHICRNGGWKLLNLEGFFLPACVHSKRNKTTIQNKKVTFIFKAFI